MSVESFDPRHIVRVLLMRWRVVAVCMLVAPAAAVVLGDKLPAKYKSRARVMVQDGKTVNPFLEDIVVDWSAKKRGAVISSVLKSPTTLERVLRDLGELQPNDDAWTIERKVDAFRRRVRVVGIGGGVFQLGMDGKDPDRVYEGLQVLVNAFVAEMLRPQKEAVARSAEFLRRQIERLRVELGDMEDALAKFKAEHAEELPDVYRMNLDAQLALRESLLEAEVSLQAGRRKLTRAKQALTTLDPVAQDLEARLVKARAKLAEMEAAYTQAHPARRAQAARVKALRQQLRQRRKARKPAKLSTLKSLARTAPNPKGEEPTDMLASELLRFDEVQGDVAGREAMVRLLKERLTQSNKNLKAFAGHERTLNRMKRELDIKNKVYRQLLARHEEALVTRELALMDEESQVWVIEPPVRPTTSSRPARKLRAIGGVFGGVFLGLALVAVMELLTARVRRREELEALLGAPVLGALPAVD